MKILRLLRAMLFLAPTFVHAALPPPYKIALQESAQAKQPFVYARVADHGFGVQYWRNDSARAVGQFAGGLIGMALGSFVDEQAAAHSCAGSAEQMRRRLPQAR